MANQISPEAISDILAAIGSHPDGASLQDVAKALKTEVPLRTLQYRLRLLVTDGRITKVADGRWTRYQLPRVGVTGDEPDLGSDVRYIAISKNPSRQEHPSVMSAVSSTIIGPTRPIFSVPTTANAWLPLANRISRPPPAPMPNTSSTGC